MRLRSIILAGVVTLGLAGAALTATGADTRGADRRSVADALASFEDALRGTTHEYRVAHLKAGTEILRQTRAFTDGDACVSGAYYAALYGTDADLKAARDWLDSYLILGTKRLRPVDGDQQRLADAIDLLDRFTKENLTPSEISEALAIVRDTEAFANGDVRVSDAVCHAGLALEKRTRGYWFLPFTARYEARRAANSLRSAQK